ncbi:MAG: hypothetical protein DRP01_01175 [Archaeoglobales archaeon]|nr:MAG: hypothetical protein DRP01_01175 [Archaeoglobales archaeon]
MRRWSEREIEVLKEYYGRIPTRDLARILSRTVDAVKQKANTLGLRFPEGSVDEELLKKILEVREG